MAVRSDIIFKYQDKEYPFSLYHGNAPALTVGDKKIVGNHISTDVVTYSHADPEEMGLLVSQYDWRKGKGGEYYEDQKKYAHSINCFAGNKGRVTLGFKKQSAVSLAGTAALSGFIDGALEEWTYNNPDNWTASATGVAKSEDEHGGDYAARIGYKNGGDAYIYQDITNGEAFAGCVVTVKAWCKTADAPDTYSRMTVDDGVDQTHTNISSAAYAQITVAHTMNAAATKLQIKFQSKESGGVVKYIFVDDVTATATVVGKTGLVSLDFGGTWVAAYGDMLIWSTNGTAITNVRAFSTDITDLCVYQNYLHVMLGAATAAWYTSDLSTFTESTAYSSSATVYTTTTSAYSSTATAVDVASTANFTAGHFAVWDAGLDTEEVVETHVLVDGNTFTLVRAQKGTTAYAHASGSIIRDLSDLAGAIRMGNSADQQAFIADSTTTIRVSTNPLNNGTPWSTVYELPNSHYTITDCLDDPNGNVIVIKQDGPYYLHEDEVVHMATELQSNAQTTYAYKGYSWKGSLFVPNGVNKLHKIDLDSLGVEDITLTSFSPGDEEMDEEVQAMCGDADWLYVCIDNGTSKELILGRTETISGSTDWVWHPAYEFTEDTDIVSMVISSVGTYKRLYMLTGAVADGVLVFTVPESYSDPMKEAGVEYSASGSLYTPWYETEFYENDKFWSEIKVAGYNFAGYTSIRVLYQLEGDGEWDDDDAWTELGFCTTSDLYSYTASPRALDYPPPTVTTFDINKRSRAIRFKFELKAALDASTTDELSPVLLRWGVWGKVERSLGDETSDNPNIGLTLRLVDSQIMRDGTVQEWPVPQQEEALWYLKRLGEPVKLVTPLGTEYMVKWSQGDFRIDLVKDDADHLLEVATMILEVV